MTSKPVRRRLTEIDKRKIACEQDWQCKMCHHKLPYVWEADHIVALCNGGSNELDNFQILCPTCHSKKTHEDLHGANRVILSPYFARAPTNLSLSYYAYTAKMKK